MIDESRLVMLRLTQVENSIHTKAIKAFFSQQGYRAEVKYLPPPHQGYRAAYEVGFIDSGYEGAAQALADVLQRRIPWKYARMGLI